MAGEPQVVQAIYSFKGSNNDELCFKKGDVITVTQKDEGWWEGTLNGKTGWFPCNYVKECKDVPTPIVPQQNQYKSVVLKDLIDSERAHVTELEGLVSNFLQPLEKSTILTSDEYKQLTGNLSEVLEIHQRLLKTLETEESKPALEQKVGRLFLTLAPQMKSVHQLYCSLHPRAVCILDKFRDDLTKYMESRGAATPGVLVLTTLLSKPFRRLDKYSGMLQELERHIEECHPDRGDTQRSLAVYKEIATACAATRRQKELELQVLTGPVRGWEGPSLSALGDIIYMGSVAVGPQHHDRYFVLFPTTLLILSVSHRLSAFIYEGKLPLSGLVVTRLEDSDQYKNAFEISAPMIEKRVAVCQSKSEANHWVELLKKHMPRTTSTVSTCSVNSGSNQKVAPSQAQFVPQPPPHMSPLIAAAAAAGAGPATGAGAGGAAGRTSPPDTRPSTQPLPPAPAIINPNNNTIIPLPPPHGALINNNHGLYQQQHHLSHHSNSTTTSRGWSAGSLRPAPPLRPCLALMSGNPANPCYSRSSNLQMISANNNNSRSHLSASSYVEDGLILDVIEAYCCTVKPRNVNSAIDLANGIATKTGTVTTADLLWSRNLMETVQILQNKLNILEYNVSTLSAELKEEKNLRGTLQSIVKNYLTGANNSREFVDSIDWPK